MLKKGDVVEIHSYKHNKSLHRIWKNVIVLNKNENDNTLIVGNDKAMVIESNGRYWKTKEPAICYFFKDYWFNVICMIKKDGIYYYCNLSSPYLYDGEAIKYIDYDLDLKFFPNGDYIVLDNDEFEAHKFKMNYDKRIEKILKYNINEMINLFKQKKEPFSKEKVLEYHKLYKKLVNKSK